MREGGLGPRKCPGEGIRHCRRLLAVAIAALPLAGCGGAGATNASSEPSSSTATVTASVTTSASATTSAPTAATICTPRAIAAVARFFAVSAAVVTTRGAIANSSFPFCTFKVHAAAGRRLLLTAEVDTEPGAYAILERTIEESAQIFPTRTHPAPIHVGHLGLDASWFPEEQQLQTTDGVRLVIVTIGSRAPAAFKMRLSAAMARAYLGRSEPKLARGPAP